MFNKQSKNSERSAHFLADFFVIIGRLLNVVKLYWNGIATVALISIKDRRFIKGDRRDFNVVGNYLPIQRLNGAGSIFNSRTRNAVYVTGLPY